MTLVHQFKDGLTRCSWPGNSDLYVRYHDEEWGVAVTGDQAVFERIALEGFQAGLSWITILKRRETFRLAFRGFDLEAVAALNLADEERLMLDPGIIRNRSKIQSTIKNAQICLEMQSRGESISDLVWGFALSASDRDQVPFAPRATSPESEALSKTLKKLGFGYVGPTTMYALMQAIGIVNDHAPGCFRRGTVK